MKIESYGVGYMRANCYLLSMPGRKDCVMVDPGGDGERLLSALHGREVAAILLTHGHYDHMGAADRVAGPDTKVYIHPLDAPMLNDPVLNVSQFFGGQVRIGHGTLPVLEGDILRAAGMEIRVLHTPGHTPGGVCYQAENALFTGDTLFRHGYGRTDFPGGDVGQLFKSLRRVLTLAKEQTIYPGHEDETSKDAEQEFLK